MIYRIAEQEMYVMSYLMILLNVCNVLINVYNVFLIYVIFYLKLKIYFNDIAQVRLSLQHPLKQMHFVSKRHNTLMSRLFSAHK